jgi:hypothetical protein
MSQESPTSHMVYLYRKFGGVCFLVYLEEETPEHYIVRRLKLHDVSLSNPELFVKEKWTLDIAQCRLLERSDEELLFNFDEQGRII